MLKITKITAALLETKSPTLLHGAFNYIVQFIYITFFTTL